MVKNFPFGQNIVKIFGLNDFTKDKNCLKYRAKTILN